MWAFWFATGLLLIGGVAPLLFGAGASSRIAGVIIPFGVAAAANAVNALMYHQGRSLAATLYFISGIAVVYGILAMLAVPLRLAVIGTCPPAPAPCAAGYEQALSSGETNGLTIAVAMGIIAILTGFFGLTMIYRRRPKPASKPASGWPAKPPEPVAAPKPAAEPAPAPEAPMAPRSEPEPAPAPSPEPMLELEAPPEMLELPPPAPEAAAEPAPKPAPKPRARRAPKRATLAPDDVGPAPSTGDAPPNPPES